MKKIKLACMSVMWGDSTKELSNPKVFESWLSDVKAAGYEGCATFDWNLERFYENHKELKSIMDKYELSLASADYFISVDFDSIRKLCDLMNDMACENLILLGGIGKKDIDFQGLAHLLNTIGEISLSFGVRTMYHHHTGFTGETLNEAEKLLNMTDNKKVFAMCDVGHATKDFIELPPAERAATYMKQNWERIRFIEFKDWCPETDLGTEVGQGLADYNSVASIIREKDYKGWITVEQNVSTQGKTPFESARASLEFIKKLGIE